MDSANAKPLALTFEVNAKSDIHRVADQNDEFLDRPLPATSWQGPVAIGDRVTIARSDGRLRTLEVMEIRRLGGLVSKMADRDTGGTWLLIISKDLDRSDAAPVRMIVEEGGTLPFAKKADTDRSL